MVQILPKVNRHSRCITFKAWGFILVGIGSIVSSSIWLTIFKDSSDKFIKSNTKPIPTSLVPSADAYNADIAFSAAVEEAIDKVDVGETGQLRVGEEAQIAVVDVPTLNSITVHIYGGSITAGREMGDKRYSMLLQSMLQYNGDNVDVVVSNFGIPASGPEYWNLCGIDSADIIISEFRINEGNYKILREWYKLAENRSKHLVVLELWSWLKPPNPAHKSATMATLPAKGNLSSVSLDLMEQKTWQELVPGYFNYTSGRIIPQECYDSIYMRSENETRTIQQCRKQYPNGMQHGTELYHEHVAQTLYNHIIHIGVINRLREDIPIDTAKSAMCFSQWNLLGGVNYGNLGDWNQTVIYNEGFSVHNVYPSKGEGAKITLNTNSTSAQLQLSCPPPYNRTAKVGYIAHSDEQESGIIRINGSQMSTRLENDNGPHVRIRQFSSSLTLPIDVFVEELPIGQYIEFTGLICSND